MKDKLQKDVTVKAFYKNVAEFVKQLKSVEKVKFVTKRNLFSLNEGFMSIFGSKNDPLGLGNPEVITLEAIFASANVTDSFRQKIKDMVGLKEKFEADSVIIVGRDDKNFETVFDADSWIQKVDVEAKKDVQGFYEPTEVKKQLIGKIERFGEEKA